MAITVRPTSSTPDVGSTPVQSVLVPSGPGVDDLRQQLDVAALRWCNEGESVEVVAAYASCLNALVERARAAGPSLDREDLA